MIQTMHEMAQSTIARVLMGIIIVLLLLFGYGSFDVFNTASSAVAEVDGEEIPRAEYEREIELQRRMAEGPVDNATLQRNVLDTLIRRSLLLDLGASLGLTIGEDALTRRIASESAFAQNGKFSEELYRRTLSNVGFTPASYRKALSDSAVIEQLQQGIGESEFVTSVELRRIESLLNQQRDLAWVDIDPASFASSVRLDDAALARYFAANRARFQIPESAVVDYIRIDSASVARSLKISDADIAAEYVRASAAAVRQRERRHLAHILLEQREGRTQAQAIAFLQAAAKRIAAGESFASVARTMSEDALSRELGGDLGFVGRGELPEQALDSAAWQLKVGQVSAPVVTSAGVHLITVLEQQLVAYPPLAEVRAQLAAKLLEQKTKERLASVGSELTEIAYEQDLAALGKRFGVAVQRSGAIPKVGVAAGIGGNAAVRTAAFSNDVRDGNFNSSVLNVDGDLVVLRLVRHQDARPMTFAEALPQVRAAMTREAQLALARTRADLLVDGVRRSGSLTPSIQSLAVTWQSRGRVQRSDPDVPAEILRAAFELPRPIDAAKASGRTLTLGNGHVVALVVSRVVDGVATSTGPEQAGLRGFLANQSGQTQFGALLEHLEAGADIERRQASADGDGDAASSP